MTVRSDQRHKRRAPCPICGGGDDDPRGKEKRCFGFTSDDGDYVHCSREELAGDIEQGNDGCFAHRMFGPCRCGTQHGEAKSGALPKDDFAGLYDYCDENGCLIYQVVRKRMPNGEKKFVQRRPDGVGGWVWQTTGLRKVPYLLPQLVTADPSKPVYVCEGEKDVDTVVELGHVATCNPMGARKWHFIADEAAKVLRGRVVVILADADDEGRAHAQDVQRRLTGVAASVRIVEPPRPYKDVTEYVSDGGDFDALVYEEPKPSIAAELAPSIPFDDLWTPEPDVNLVIPAFGIAPGPAHLVTGSWYTGKTVFLTMLGLSVASGRDLFGLYGVQRGRWRHFDHEMGKRHLKRYLRRIRTGMCIDIEDLRGHMDMCTLPRLNLCTPEAEKHYTDLLSGYSLCTIDPLRSAAPGKDENKSEFREWIDLLGGVSDRTSCAIVVLHHGGKPTEGAERRNTGRGSSAIDDAVQSKFVLTAQEKGGPILVTHEKTRELGATLDDFYLVPVKTEDGFCFEYQPPEQMAESVVKANETKDAERIAKAKATIKQVFEKYAGKLPGPRDNALALIKGDRNTISRAFSEMLAEGKISRAGSRFNIEFSMPV